jgi:quercetin dioxygenase-like cupin family protein
VSRPSDDEDLLRDLQDSLAAAVQPAELGAELRDRLRRRTLREAEAIWIEIAPFVEVRELRRDEVAGTHTSLMRMRPGGFVPGHRHEREEEFFVLEGECHIGTHKLVAGDVHIAPAGTVHEPVTTQTGVLVLLRGEYPHPSPV